MPEPEPAEITGLLHAWRNGDQAALDRLMPIIYAELRQLARRSLRQQPAGDTLQPTALVNEAYLRLLGADAVDWRDRAHFFAVSAQVMRWILVDRSRSWAAARRGGGTPAEARLPAVNLEELPDASSQRSAELIAVDDALNALAKIDANKARLVELRFFGGLSIREIAETMAVTTHQVERDWKLAKAWLLRELAS